MSDVLDIQSHCCSEFEDETDNVTLALKNSSKNRKGRGFVGNSGGELKNIRVFDQLTSLDSQTSSNCVQPQKSVEGWVLFITGIHEEAGEDDIMELFQEYGAIKSSSMNLDRRTGYTKGYALIEFERFEDACKARENLDESQLLDQTIRVNWTFLKAPNRNCSRKRKTKSRFQNY